MCTCVFISLGTYVGVGLLDHIIQETLLSRIESLQMRGYYSTQEGCGLLSMTVFCVWFFFCSRAEDVIPEMIQGTWLDF